MQHARSTHVHTLTYTFPCPTEPFEHWFYIHEWAPLIIFFGTYLGIVRNKKIPHVARYHIMMVRPWPWLSRCRKIMLATLAAGMSILLSAAVPCGGEKKRKLLRLHQLEVDGCCVLTLLRAFLHSK